MRKASRIAGVIAAVGALSCAGNTQPAEPPASQQEPGPSSEAPKQASFNQCPGAFHWGDFRSIFDFVAVDRDRAARELRATGHAERDVGPALDMNYAINQVKWLPRYTKVLVGVLPDNCRQESVELVQCTLHREVRCTEGEGDDEYTIAFDVALRWSQDEPGWEGEVMVDSGIRTYFTFDTRDPEENAEPSTAEVKSMPSPAPASPAVARILELVDRRFRDVPPRSRNEVLHDMGAMESTLKNTPTASAERATLMYRIAEAYAELRAIAGADTPTDPRKATIGAMAIRRYESFVAEYPNEARLADARFAIVLEHLHRNDLPKAKSAIYQVLTQTPSSPLVPLAYYASAELFRDEAAQTPAQWKLAEMGYQRSRAFPPQVNPLYCVATLRQAESVEMQNRLAEARTLLSEVTKCIDEHTEQRGRELVQKEAVAMRQRLDAPR